MALVMDLVEYRPTTECRHPWELSRTESILKILNKNPADYQYADIGAGDLFFTKKLTAFTNKKIYAVDPHFNDQNFHKQIIQFKSLDELPENRIDCAILMDVLEHVEADLEFLARVYKKVKLGGSLVITVPAHPSLFSSHDVFLNHLRRYMDQDLRNLITQACFIIEKIFYFYSTLYFVRYFQTKLERLMKTEKEQKGIGMWKYRESNPFTFLLKEILNLDFYMSLMLSNHNIIIPGLSLCAICKKRSA